MADKTITSANSVFVITIPGLYPVPTAIEGYAADASFAFDAVDTAETVLGVDGKMSAGWVPRMYKQTVSLQADSKSRILFDGVVTAQDTARDIYRLQAVISLPSIGRSYSMNNGVLTNWKPLPDGKRVLQATDCVITWESVTPAII